MSRLGDMIRASRLSSGMSAKALAKKCGVSEGYILDVESGSRIVNDEVAARILKAMGRSQDALMPQGDADASASAPSSPVTSRPVTGRTLNAKSAKAVPKQPAAVQPTDAWRQALSALIKPVPVIDQIGAQIGTVSVAVESDKIRGASPERVFFYQVPDDSMRLHHRLYPNDRVLILPDKTLQPGLVILVKYEGRLMLRTLREYHSGKMLLAADNDFARPYPEKETQVLGRADMVFFEIN